MPLKPIELERLLGRAKNVYEAIVSTSKRARQINEETKIEFNQRIETIAVKPDVGENEESDINPDQLKISMEFEKRPKPTDVAIDELLADKLAWRYKEKEQIAPPKDDEESA